MAEEEKEKEAPVEKKKFDIGALKEKLKDIDWKDKKVLGGVGAILLIVIILVFLMFSGGDVKKGTEVEDVKIDFSALERAKSYVELVSSAGAKPAPFMSTIRSDDRALQFSMYLGINQEDAPEEFKMAMTPLTSVVLRFLSTKSQGEILTIIQDPDEEGKSELISRLNKVLRRRGLTGDKVMVVEVQFTKYFFPNI
ncbi:MAG: hypothetical protein COB02_00605 [Candidatus Cloacimonadota bacterium]|nr:MAG: hypothetical protein COB02_00605 [Candidatus Cloacimonadota bacterium]